MSDDEKKRSRFYNLDAYHEVYKKTQRRRGRVGRIIGRFTGFLDGIQGLFVGLMLFPLTIGTFLAIVYGASLGPIGFVVVFGSVIGGLSFFVDRKVGKSLQFGDHKILKGSLATAIGGAITIGFLFLLIFLGRL